MHFLLTKGRQNDMFRHLLNEYSIVFCSLKEIQRECACPRFAEKTIGYARL